MPFQPLCNAGIHTAVQYDHAHLLPYLLGQSFQSVLYEIHFWWVEARFGKSVQVNRVKDAYDHVVPPCESQHHHTEKRTKETLCNISYSKFVIFKIGK